MVDSEPTVALAAIAVVAALAGAIVLLVKTFNESKSANHAVNHIDFDEHRIYDRVAQTQDMVASHTALLNDKLDHLTKELAHVRTELNEHIEWGLARHQETLANMGKVRDKLWEHDQWERQEKYGEGA